MGRTEIAGFRCNLYQTLQAMARKTATFHQNINDMDVVQGELCIDNAIDTNPAPIMGFARTLHPDIETVRNAIEMLWGNSQAEGQIDRLKSLKRAMYGRAGPELLGARKLPLRHTD